MNKINKKPIAHLICGYIGAGKTTYAKKLQEETGTFRITKDEWIIRIFGNDPRFDDFDKYDSRITDLSFDIAIDLLKAGNDVIIDDGFWVRTQRDEFRERVAKVGGEIKFYYVKCSEYTMKKRIKERNSQLKESSFMIDEKMFEFYKKYWDEFSDDEKYILINND